MEGSGCGLACVITAGKGTRDLRYAGTETCSRTYISIVTRIANS